MNKRIALLALLAAAIAAYFWFDLGAVLSLENFKQSQAEIDAYYRSHPALVIGGFFVGYVIVTALSLPGAAILSLVAGALFGVVIGTIVVSFASTIGATLAFLSARFLLRDWVSSKFGARLQAIDDGIARDGAFYLFTIRLIPLFPFFIVNLLMGLTRIKTRTFYWVSQIGMFPATIVFVNAGTQISKIDSTAGLLSPSLIGSFILLGCFPWIARGLVAVGKKFNAS
ncbi:MAG: TVP38/TMEM64 family protein [Sphingorhabdus sp.]